MIEEANNGRNGKRIVKCNLNTLNTPYKDGFTNFSSGMAIISIDNNDIGSILYMVEGQPKLFINPKVGGVWQGWKMLAIKDDVINSSGYPMYQGAYEAPRNTHADDMVYPGLYYCGGVKGIPINDGTSESSPNPRWGYMLVISNSDQKEIKQIFWFNEGYDTMQRYKRSSDAAWSPWKEYAMKNDFTPRNIEIPFAEGIVSDTGHNKVTLSVSGNIAKIHFRAKRTTGNYTIATIPGGYRPIFQANCALTIPVNSGPATTAYSAVAESGGILRFSSAVPSEQIFEGDIVYIIN